MLWFPPSNSSWIETLSPGHQGTLRTLEVMRWLCRRDYRSDFVRDFLAGLSAPEELYLWARDEIRFKEDPPDIERVADFQRTSDLRYGDCDDKAVWLSTALLAKGYQPRFCIQSYTGRSWDHVYCDYWDWSAMRWVSLDPSADGHTGFLGVAGWRQPLPVSGSEMIYPV
jgi:hypothetical protein